MAASAVSVRCGASKNTIVRCSAARSARRRARSPALRGRKPSKQNRSTGSPETASAVSTAEGPGTAMTSTPASRAAATSRYPGSDTLGIPASVTSSTRSPASIASTSDGVRAVSLPSKYETTRPVTVTPSSRVSRPSRRVSSAATTSAVASSCASRGEASSTRPIGRRCENQHARSLADRDDRRAGEAASEPGRALPGLSRTSDGRWSRRPPNARHGGSAAEDPFVGWVGAISVGLLALFLRLWKLGTPHEFLFDETYYAKDAWSLLHFGYAREYADGTKANAAILAGNPDGLWKDNASMAVHPDLGKWLIGLGEKAFGMDPFGWRIAAAVVGSLMVVVLVRLVRRMTGSTLLGMVAGLLLCFDGLHFVLSRIALLDIFVAFFILLAVHCHVADRDWSRARLARLLEPDGGHVTAGTGPSAACSGGPGWSRPASAGGWPAAPSGRRSTRSRPSGC